MIRFIFVLFFLPLFSHAQVCSRRPSNTSYHNALKSCHEGKTKKLTGAALSAFNGLTDSTYCQLSTDERTQEALLEKLCRDPNGTVCANKGQILDSDCNYMAFENSEAESDPSFLDKLCEGDARWKDFLNTKRNECRGQDEKTCQDLMSLRYPEKKALIYRDLIYTKEKIAEVRKMFDGIRGEYASMIANSTKLNDASKKMMIETLQNTRLALDEKDLTNKEFSDCFNHSPGKTSTAASNVMTSGSTKRTVLVCMGMMASLDKVNPISILHVLAHEIAHSFDPCALENVQLAKNQPIPHVYSYLYPDTLKCLRGGRGTHACENGALNCNDPRGVADFCEEKFKDQAKDCTEQLKLLPSCSLGKSDPDERDHTIAHYRKEGTNLDQAPEAFADFMAAEVISKILDRNQMKKSDKINGFLSMAAATSRLHGVCLTRNTPDSHPPGFLRMNRIIMSSDRFRQTMGCSNGAPKTTKAGVTCPGI